MGGRLRRRMDSVPKVRRRSLPVRLPRWGGVHSAARGARVKLSGVALQATEGGRNVAGRRGEHPHAAPPASRSHHGGPANGRCSATAAAGRSCCRAATSSAVTSRLRATACFNRGAALTIAVRALRHLPVSSPAGCCRRRRFVCGRTASPAAAAASPAAAAASPAAAAASPAAAVRSRTASPAAAAAAASPAAAGRRGTASPAAAGRRGTASPAAAAASPAAAGHGGSSKRVTTGRHLRPVSAALV
jgi:hypothetical protein